MAELGRDLGRVDDREARDRGQGPRVPREVGEEGLLVGEDGRVRLFGRAAELDAEEAAVHVVVDVACREVGLGDEAEAEADAAVAVVCSFWWVLGPRSRKG